MFSDIAALLRYRATTMSESRRLMRATAALLAAAIPACRSESRPTDTTRAGGQTTAATQTASGCPGDNAGLTLASGFCATVFADSIGHARHITVAANGDVYVNTWSGAYYNGDKGPAGGYLVVLRDTTGDGRADL